MAQSRFNSFISSFSGFADPETSVVECSQKVDPIFKSPTWLTAKKIIIQLKDKWENCFDPLPGTDCAMSITCKELQDNDLLPPPIQPGDNGKVIFNSLKLNVADFGQHLDLAFILTSREGYDPCEIKRVVDIEDRELRLWISKDSGAHTCSKEDSGKTLLTLYKDQIVKATLSLKPPGQYNMEEDADAMFVDEDDTYCYLDVPCEYKLRTTPIETRNTISISLPEPRFKGANEAQIYLPPDCHREANGKLYLTWTCHGRQAFAEVSWVGKGCQVIVERCYPTLGPSYASY